MKKLILFFLLLLLPITVQARDSFNIACDRTTLNEFNEFTCRTSIRTNFNFNKITFEVNTTEGLSLTSVRSNHRALWQVENKGKVVTATTTGNRSVNGLQEFGILLFQTTVAGNQEIKIEKIILSNPDNTLEIKDINQEIKVLSSDNRLKGIFIDDTLISRFSPEILNYHLEIPKDATEINLTAIARDPLATISGIGEIKLDANQNEFVLPVQVTSTSGVRKVYVLILRRQGAPKNNITASNIQLFNNNERINFRFNPNIFEYRVEVEEYTRFLNLNVSVDSDFSIVTGFGTRRIDLHDGDNFIIVRIRNTDGEIKNYVLIVTRVLSDKSGNTLLRSLNIRGYNLRFNKRVHRYELAIRRNHTQLDIEAIPEHKYASVIILDNEDLKAGSLIRIIVTAENGSRLTYQIAITYHEAGFNYFFLSISSLIVVITGVRYYKCQKLKAIITKQEELKAKALAELAEKRKKAAAKRKATAKKKPVAKKTTTTRKTPVKAAPKKTSTTKSSAKKTTAKKTTTTKPTTVKPTIKKTGTKPKTVTKKTTTPKKTTKK